MNKLLYQNSNLYKLPNDDNYKLWNNTEFLKFLICVKQENEIEPELKEMLLNILKALKIKENEVEIINFSNKVHLTIMLNETDVDKVLCFGAEAEDIMLNMNLAQYHLYEINKFKLILVNDLVDVYNNQNLKSALWKLLQKMFEI